MGAWEVARRLLRLLEPDRDLPGLVEWYASSRPRIEEGKRHQDLRQALTRYARGDKAGAHEILAGLVKGFIAPIGVTLGRIAWLSRGLLLADAKELLVEVEFTPPFPGIKGRITADGRLFLYTDEHLGWVVRDWLPIDEEQAVKALFSDLVTTVAHEWAHLALLNTAIAVCSLLGRCDAAAYFTRHTVAGELVATAADLLVQVLISVLPRAEDLLQFLKSLKLDPDLKSYVERAFSAAFQPELASRFVRCKTWGELKRRIRGLSGG